MHRELVIHLAGSDHAALYALVGALGGVIVGSVFSYLLQRAKIGADTEQLTQRLEHDTEQRELQAIRQVLDDAGEALAKGRVNISRIANLWRQGLEPDDPNKLDAEAEQRTLGHLAESSLHRLRLRLPEDDAVGERLDEAIDKLISVAAFMIKSAQQDNFQDHADTLVSLGDEYEAAVKRFLATAQKRYGIQRRQPATEAE
ncbi:MAG TPA: hypothetical protein VH081_07330 [Solirubrobacteraceae bacterium]|jgi:hypothetical protein|nr:hypothetical protein [Solirubrobacteraceae bacterium]